MCLCLPRDRIWCYLFIEEEPRVVDAAIFEEDAAATEDRAAEAEGAATEDRTALLLLLEAAGARDGAAAGAGLGGADAPPPLATGPLASFLLEKIRWQTPMWRSAESALKVRPHCKSQNGQEKRDNIRNRKRRRSMQQQRRKEQRTTHVRARLLVRIKTTVLGSSLKLCSCSLISIKQFHG